MQDPSVNLGVCFSGSQLYYALNSRDDLCTLKRIGKIEFNFDINDSLITSDRESLSGLLDTVDKLIKEHQVTNLRCLYPANQECWSTLPKSVYDQSSERESYLKLLMYGKSRQTLEPFWFDVSNRDYRFLSVRDKTMTDGYKQLGDASSFSEICSDFEIGLNWINVTGRRDSFLMLGCYQGHIAISSFLMGKFRAATFIKFRHIEDLSYLWLQQGENLSWLRGVHDSIYFYGEKAFEIKNILNNFLDGGSNHIKLDNLADMDVKAGEETYSFNLEEAFPAIILAL